MSADKDQELGFDERLARLEKLVADLEQGGLGLEASLESYKEGVALLKGCRSQLNGYRKQVEELFADADGSLRPFDEDPDVAGSE